MSDTFVILPGDGIGPEIVNEAEKVLNWLKDNEGLDIEVQHDLIGGQAYDEYGVPFADETLEKCRAAKAILMGSVGGPKWDGVDYDKRPEAGLLRARKELNLFANLRPALVFDALVDASSLKPEIVKGLDILIVRELTGGVYFGEPRGVDTNDKGERYGFNTLVYSEPEVERIARVAFDMAMKRDKRLCSVDKANVLESTVLWREVVERVAKDFPEVDLSHMYVDNAAMQLVRDPKQFDVIVTTNMFGDILSDCAAMLTGSIGMLPSASLNESGQGMYEPCHGSAPDIAGQGIANPIGTILSMAMLLRYSLNLEEEAASVERSVEGALAEGYRTPDIAADGGEMVDTARMGDVIAGSV